MFRQFAAQGVARSALVESAPSSAGSISGTHSKLYVAIRIVGVALHFAIMHLAGSGMHHH